MRKLLAMCCLFCLVGCEVSSSTPADKAAPVSQPKLTPVVPAPAPKAPLKKRPCPGPGPCPSEAEYGVRADG